MQILDLEQNSPEWYAARLGVATASSFSKILTPTGKESTSADAYANELLAEMVVGGAVEGWEGNQWSERGNNLEAQAAEAYSFIMDTETNEVGFCLNDDNKVGCSPDRLVGGDGLLEIKCPKASTHIAYLLKNTMVTTYIPQVQGQLYVTGRKWCDFMSYYPEMPPLIIRVERDEEYITKLAGALGRFQALMQKKKDRLIELNYLKKEEK